MRAFYQSPKSDSENCADLHITLMCSRQLLCVEFNKCKLFIAFPVYDHSTDIALKLNDFLGGIFVLINQWKALQRKLR